MGLMINIGFYVVMLFFNIKAFHMYRKRGGIKGIGGFGSEYEKKKTQKNLEDQALDAAMMM